MYIYILIIYILYIYIINFQKSSVFQGYSIIQFFMTSFVFHRSNFTIPLWLAQVQADASHRRFSAAAPVTGTDTTSAAPFEKNSGG